MGGHRETRHHARHHRDDPTEPPDTVELVESPMIRRLIRVGSIAGLLGLAVSGCSGSSGGGNAGGNGCGSGGSPSTGQCTGLASCGSPPCKQGCTLQIAVVSGFPDTCSGAADQCETFVGEQGCLMQGCTWSGGGSSGDDCTSGEAGSDDGGGSTFDASALDGTCSGTGGIKCSSFSPPSCPPEDRCYEESDFDAGTTICGGEGLPCSSWSSTSHSFGDPTACRQNGCAWSPN